MGSIDNRLKKRILLIKEMKKIKYKPICLGLSSCLAGNVLSNGT
jgi:hypothetical protein